MTIENIAEKRAEAKSFELIKINEVIFREDLYPRAETNPSKVQQYLDGGLEVLPPIEVNQNYELIDGWHRWTAYKKSGATEIPATITETNSDAALLELGIERNAKHGLQLSQEDKRSRARKIYRETTIEERGAKKKRLATLLSVTEKTVNNWLSRIDKDQKEERDTAIINLWLACHTQEEIAQAVGVTQQGIGKFIEEIQQKENFRFVVKPGQFSEITDETERWERIAEHNRENAEHEADFTAPPYNIWKQQEKTPGSSHFGNSEVRWLDNLIYLYTKPFDIVVDPFAGGGSAVDICKKRLRRYYVSDRKPIIEREKEIRSHDITQGLPEVPRWKDVKLVYLDPPYWKQAENRYSEDPTDLANMDLDAFNSALSGLIKGFAKKLKNGEEKYIALIIQPTQWNAPERQFVDHIGDMLRLVNLPVDMRYSVPYESQQCNAQMVNWAKESRRCLVLTREIIVWRV